MKGKISYRNDTGRYYVSFYVPSHRKTFKIYSFRGLKLTSRDIAEELLTSLRSDYQKGTLQIEQYVRDEIGVVEFLHAWLKEVSHSLKPATVKDYRNSIVNHLSPFFEAENIRLSDIRYDTLLRLLTSINRTGKGKLNSMACLRSALTFAWRSERIQHIPPFPKRKAYHIVEPQIKWLPTQRQFNILELIPKDDQPVFFFLKYYMRRPAEACSIFESDFSENVFTICRTFSNDILTDTTKTGKVHTLPLIEDFKKHLDHARRIKARNGIISPYLFVNLRARNPGKHWTTGTLRTVWKLASKRAFEFVGLYEGLKHSSASQFINEKGLSLDQLMEITGHRQLDSIKAYAHTQMARKKELLETVVPISAKRPKGKT